jgi:hypothetical protein
MLAPPAALLVLLVSVVSPAGDAGDSAAWNARDAEHLLNRAAFGATPDEVRAAVAAGRDATVDALFPVDAGALERPSGAPDLPGSLTRPESLHARAVLRREGYVELQSDHILPLGRGGAQWAERMLDGRDPLRERMTLFWHGHLVSSYKEVGDSYEMLAQIELLRRLAFGPFGELLRGVARDPAMLQYLGNAKNVADHPNENWARELMELFALGDGHYSEDDVKEVARAFTGWSDERSRFAFHRVDHDFGRKTVLGLTGMLDGDDVIERILAEPAAGRFLAAKLIAFFEGLAPDEERVEIYAACLREHGFEIEPFLRRLFADPAFYRDAVVGTRIASPVEYVVGVARRLHAAPPGELVVAAATVLGQRLYYPPSVKGWEPGRAWITTGSLMQRSNVAGALLGRVAIARVLHDEEFDAGSAPSIAWMHPPAELNQPLTAGFPMLRWIEHSGWKARVALGAELASLLGPDAAAADDARVAAAALDAWLAVAAAPGTTAYVAQFLHDERERSDLAPGELFTGGADAEELLARLAHLVASLPEAQLE